MKHPCRYWLRDTLPQLAPLEKVKFRTVAMGDLKKPQSVSLPIPRK